MQNKINTLIKKIFIIMLILLLSNINLSNANNFDELDYVLNHKKDFSCTLINDDINNYPEYKIKIDKFFINILLKEEKRKEKILMKEDNRTEEEVIDDFKEENLLIKRIEEQKKVRKNYLNKINNITEKYLNKFNEKDSKKLYTLF
jgi:hypothetical protein